MSSIERLTVSGVRSFNPNPAERQQIVFQKPLTIILGKNGAGKTTIIESLLHATTGEMPPGAAGSEKSAFVYDPKAMGESEVKAQIRLIFTAKTGARMQVVRSFQASRNRGKTKFDTLDSVIATEDPETGKIQSAPYRASDCDREMADLLGVPRAVLENVIFCHQEDGNWPLGAPSELKKRFDDVFASTRYVAALDNLRETAKGYKQDLKDTEAVLIALREHREQARILLQDVDEKEEQIRLIQGRNKEMEPRLQQLRDAVTQLDSVAHQADKLTQELSTLRGRLGEKERALHAMQQSFTASGQSGLPQGTVEEQQARQRDFDAHLAKTRETLSTASSEKERLEAALRQAQQRFSAAQVDLSVLERSAASHASNVKQLQQVIATMTTEFVAGEGEVDAPALRRFEASVASKVAKARSELEDLRRRQQQAVLDASGARDQLLRAKDADAKERELLHGQINNIAETLARLQREHDGSVNQANIDALQQEIATLTAKAKEQLEAQRRGQASAEAQAVMQQLQAAQGELSDLSAKKSACSSAAEAVVRMSYLRDSIRSREAAAQSAMSRVCPALNAFGLSRLTEGGAVPSVAVASEAAESARARKAKALAQGESDRQIAQQSATELKVKLAAESDRLRSIEAELVQKRSIVASVLGLEDGSAAAKELPGALRAGEETLAKATRKLTSLQSMAKCYGDFIRDAKAENSCVVCKRSLDTHELAQFVKINEERQSTTPQLVSTAKDEQAKHAEAVDRLRKASSVAERVIHLEGELPGVRTSISSLEATLREKEAVVADLKTKCRDLSRQLEQAQSMLGDLAHIGSDEKETQRMSAELSELVNANKSDNLAVGDDGNPIPSDVLHRRYDEKAAEVERLLARQLEVQAKASAEGENNNGIQDQLAAKRQELSDATAAARRNADLASRSTDLQREREKLMQRINGIDSRRVELTKKIEQEESRIQALGTSHATEIKSADSALQAAEQEQHRFSASAKSVHEFLSSQHSEKVANARASQRTIEKEVRDITDKITALNDTIKNARTALDEQQKQRQVIEDSVRILETAAAVEQERSRVAYAERELKALRDEKLKDVVDFVGESESVSSNVINTARDKCREKMSSFERQRAQNEGALQTLLRDVHERKARLADEKYADIDKRFSVSFIQAQTLELTIEDIEKYYRALDKAVSSYHAEKVQQINKIIAELWRSTYRGSDIECIEIRSEDDTTTSTINRRSYRYRVVMKRGDTELDMRGRCSAGQKVLASVIIRMALSEAFCCDCGILALDEPTTNLDTDNARALAEALRDLLHERRAVSHFQLVVITHDEDFVKTLGSNHRAETFFYVQKDREGTFSTIEQRRFAEFFR